MPGISTVADDIVLDGGQLGDRRVENRRHTVDTAVDH